MSEVPPSERMHDRSRRELAPMNAANLDELRRFTEPSDAEIEAMRDGLREQLSEALAAASAG